LVQLFRGIFSQVVQSSGALPQHQATWHTQVSQTSPFLFKALSISGRISSQPASFPVFSVLTAKKASAAVMAFYSPKWTSCASNGAKMSGFKSSLIYLLHLPRMSSLWLSKTPFLSLMDPATIDFWP